MIPTLLVIGAPLGFVAGVMRRNDVMVVGVAATLFAWIALLFTVGGVPFSPGDLALATVVAFGNLLVGVLVGRGLGIGMRALFGMTGDESADGD